MEQDPSDASPGGQVSYAALHPRDLLRRAAASASTYTFGVFGVRAAEFLLLPLYWALLSPGEYGILAVAAAVSEFLRAVFGLGLSEAITRFYHDWPEAERARRVGAVWMGAWAASVAPALIVLLLAPALLAPLLPGVPVDPYLQLAVLVALTGSMVQVPLTILRIMEKARLYVAGTLITTLTGAGLAIWFIAGLDRGAQGMLEAQTLAYGLAALGYAVVLLTWIRPAWDLGTLREVASFSLPLVPSKLLEAGAVAADRFLLEKLVSLETLGIYHAARQLGRGVEMLGYSLLTAWIPFQMRVLAERPDDGRRIIAGIAPWFLGTVVVSGVGLSLIAPPLIPLMGLDSYLGMVGLIPLAVLPGVVLSMAHIVIQGYIIARKTQFAWLRSGARLVTVVVATLALTPFLGVTGALVALTLAALVQGMVGYGLSQRFFPIPFRWGRVSVMVGLGIAAVAALRVVPLAAPMPLFALGVLMTLVFSLVSWTLLRRGPSSAHAEAT